MSVFLGIDAGATKTDYVLAGETALLARVRTGTIKRMRVDAATAARNLDEALLKLTDATGIHPREITRTCIGTAGNTVPLVVDWLREAFAERVGGHLLLLGDVEIALDAAFPGRGGVVVIAGTGSNVAGRTEAGHITTSGGWGPALADQGSGHRIGQEALRSIFLAKDQGRTTQLLNAVLTFWNLDSAESLIAYANQIPSPDFSRLAKVVKHCAEQDDEVAREVLATQGRELAYLVRLTMRRLRLSSDDQRWTPPLAFTGSIMENVLPVREALLEAVREEFPEVHALPAVVDPIDGAVTRARQG